MAVDELPDIFSGETVTPTKPTVSTETGTGKTDAKMTLKGDSNCDKEVNMADAVFIMQCIANPDKYQFTEVGEANADADGSGDISNKDALTIQKFKLGLIKEL